MTAGGFLCVALRHFGNRLEASRGSSPVFGPTDVQGIQPPIPVVRTPVSPPAARGQHSVHLHWEATPRSH
jgi:hypothetical protein